MRRDKGLLHKESNVLDFPETTVMINMSFVLFVFHGGL